MKEATTYSYSRVSTFDTCPYKYKCQYLDKLVQIQDITADNPLIVGTAMHEAIEGVEDWKGNYLANLNISTDESVTEILKIEILSEKVRVWLQEHFINLEFEREIHTRRGFIGYVDCIATDEDGKKWIIDFKYSNSQYYLQSPQVHIYKSVVDRTGEKIDHLAYLLIPKLQIRQKKTETIIQFRNRLLQDLEETELQFSEVEYDPTLIKDFGAMVRTMFKAYDFPKESSKLCPYCDYKKLCQEGFDDMLIPKNEKVKPTPDTLKKVWLYGAPFSGKTYLANQFPDALLINTDGNTKYVDSPRIHICDSVEMQGRIAKRTLAWDVFKSVIKELEEGQGKEYKTLVVDLLDDMYEFCRLYMYDKLKISHESDDSYAAWDKVRTEFLSTIKRLVALPYNIVLISQEDMARDITKRSGDKITSIMPALQDKVARKVSGMVDIVLRVVNDGGNRFLQNKPADTIFGGGRLAIKAGDYPCTIDSINDMYTHIEADTEVK
jgi:phage nucleotide-binding protein